MILSPFADGNSSPSFRYNNVFCPNLYVLAQKIRGGKTYIFFLSLESAVIKKFTSQYPLKKRNLPMKKILHVSLVLTVTCIITTITVNYHFYYLIYTVLMILYFVMMMRWEHLDFNHHFYFIAQIRGKQKICYIILKKIFNLNIFGQ